MEFAPVDKAEAQRRLAGCGVPEIHWNGILQYAAQVRVEPGSWLGGVLALGLVCAAGAALLWAQGALSDFVFAKAMVLASQTNGILAYENTGFGPLLLFFALLFSGVPLFLALETRDKKRASTALSLIINDTRLRRRTHSVEKALLGTVGTDEVLDRLHGQAWPWLLYPLAVLSSAALVILMAETNSFYVVGPGGIDHHRFWPPYTTAHYNYADAERLEVGCNHTDRDDFLTYDAFFAGGESFNLGDARPIGMSLVAALERFDTWLPADTPRERWSWLDRDSMAPMCLARWSGSVDDGPARIERLLRTTASSE